MTLLIAILLNFVKLLSVALYRISVVVPIRASLSLSLVQDWHYDTTRISSSRRLGKHDYG